MRKIEVIFLEADKELVEKLRCKNVDAKNRISLDWYAKTVQERTTI